MAYVITVAMLKGGTAKTTTAAHLLAALAARGPTLGIDGDGQGSLLSWAETAEHFPAPVVAMPTRTIHRDVPRLADGHDWVVIDTPNDPSRDQAVVRSALRAADLVVVPIAPSPVEFSRLHPTLELLDDVRADRDRPLPAVALLTRVRTRTRSAVEAPGVLARLSAAGLDLCDVHVPLREHIAGSFGDMRPADEYRTVADTLTARYATTAAARKEPV